MVEVFVPMLLGFFIVLFLGPVIIPLLIRLKMGNTEREELKSHQKKMGTPSMGGVMILISLVVCAWLFCQGNEHALAILALTLGFGLIGFLDDFLKAVKKKSDGLIAWQKMLLQILVTTGFVVYLVNYSDISLEMRIPFTGAYFDMGWAGIVIMYIAILGTVNGANFTDGLDGLATTVTIVIAAFFGIVSIRFETGLTPLIASMIGALLGFLMHNVHPAKVFMGDTGSLALGGFVAAVAYVMQMPLFLIIVAFVYLMEIVSVILQVGYFKLTHGKRIFRMAPIHHHFELGGWSEVKVVAVFSTITAMLCVFAYYSI